MPERIIQSSPAAVPLANPACPLCGGPNSCAPARSGSFAEACWCESVAIAPDTLARIAPGLRGTACLCAACASGRPPRAASG